ncbi:hypothetical protein P8452_22121 [Trifolium repens]|nr:hypothetical protein P8452_22121 [Trifolium repens]
MQRWDCVGRARGSFLKVGKYTERGDADLPIYLVVVLEYFAVELIHLPKLRRLTRHSLRVNDDYNMVTLLGLC